MVDKGVDRLNLSRSNYLQGGQFNTFPVLLFHSIPSRVLGFVMYMYLVILPINILCCRCVSEVI